MSKCSFLLVAAFCLGLFQTQTNATPAVPTGLTVAWASFHQVALAWEDDAEASAWRVWRNGELAAETTQDSFFEDGLAAGMEWSYSVAAVDAAGVSGTAAVAAQYTYTVNGDGTIRTRTNYGNAGEWEETRRDFLGRPVRTDYPDGTFALREYDAQGRVAREVSPAGRATLYGYGHADYGDVAAIDMDSDGVIDYAGPDLVQATRSSHARLECRPVRRVQSWIFGGSDATPRLLSQTDESGMGGHGTHLPAESMPFHLSSPQVQHAI